MRMRCTALFIVAIGCGWSAGAAAAPKGSSPDAKKPAARPLKPEIRPSSPEDEALRRLVGRRTSHKSIMLSSGPPTRPHKVLGAVKVEMPAGKDATKTGPNLYVNELLRTKAVETYGADNVDGIVNVKYETGSAGKVRASGTAVHFDAPPAKPPQAQSAPDKPAEP